MLIDLNNRIYQCNINLNYLKIKKKDKSLNKLCNSKT